MREISITELQNLKIGQAENAQAGTGCTVFLLGENGAPVGLDVRGGGPASRESELLKPTAAAQASACWSCSSEYPFAFCSASSTPGMTPADPAVGAATMRPMEALVSNTAMA